MTPALYALGKACSRHGWIVVGIWAVLFAGFVAVDRSIGDNLSDDLTLPGTDSQSATDVLQDKFPSRANGTVPIVFVAPDGGKVSDSKYKDAITSVYTSYTRTRTSPPR